MYNSSSFDLLCRSISDYQLRNWKHLCLTGLLDLAQIELTLVVKGCKLLYLKRFRCTKAVSYCVIFENSPTGAMIKDTVMGQVKHSIFATQVQSLFSQIHCLEDSLSRERPLTSKLWSY